MNIEDLTLEEKIGQMFMIGMDTNYITERIRTMINKYKIGGIILYRKNFNTYQDMLKLINDLKCLNKKNKLPLFIAVDQEGGRVNRMPSEIKNLPAAHKLASIGNTDIIKNSAKITGELLKKSGFNLNFAPVLDIKRFNLSHAIGDRCYGENKEDVSKYGISVMKELQNQGIISVIKHFPGHGSTKQDSHILLPVINSSIEYLENEDMYPFQQAINNGADAILVGHLLIKKTTGIYPASLSRKFITKYLRKKFRFKGLVITDDLKMKAIKLIYGPNLAVEKAIQAGNDIIIFRFSHAEEIRIFERTLNLIRKGKIRESRINKSVQRIIKMKEKYNITNEISIEGANIEKINNEIEKIRTIVNESKVTLNEK
ncbi:MAG: beta-N-acetylhexosaminidase [Clostridia bacterium]|nr:beta-N-acetylhexosaminidase [Clostridia bacterium]